MATRVLILTADIGAGHDLPAELLRDAIHAREPGAEVTIADGLDAMGPLIHAATRQGAETILQHARPLFDLQYYLAARWGPTRRLGGMLLLLLGGRGLKRLIARTRPDVIVSTYPGTTEALGRLRALRRLPVPCVSAITDLAALRFWAHPGIDLHMVIHPESAAEVAAVAGPGARTVAVRGLSRPEFEAPPSRGEARAALGLPAEGPIVLVSGGGWGMGDLVDTARVALERRDALVACLCGSNPAVRARVQAALGDEPRARIEGFTDRICEWLAAADVLVHSTAGLTVLEAQLCGTWAISYGWGVAHIRLNNLAYRRFGLAEVAATPDELRAALGKVLAAPRPRDETYAARPAAADAVLDLIRSASPRRAGSPRASSPA